MCQFAKDCLSDLFLPQFSNLLAILFQLLWLMALASFVPPWSLPLMDFLAESMPALDRTLGDTQGQIST